MWRRLTTQCKFDSSDFGSYKKLRYNKCPFASSFDGFTSREFSIVWEFSTVLWKSVCYDLKRYGAVFEEFLASVTVLLLAVGIPDVAERVGTHLTELHPLSQFLQLVAPRFSLAQERLANNIYM